jgi:GNAT superfamily N-acetyltransferase
MPLDLSACTIRVPVGDSLLPLYEFLSGCFPADRPVFDEMTRTGKRFYTLTCYALYRGQEILGNVSLMPMRVWLGGRAAPVVGVACVATAPQHRRQGVARHLLGHALGLVDRQDLPSVLFTGVPETYRGAGFQSVPQPYLAACASAMDFHARGFDGESLAALDDRPLGQLATIYAGEYPDYDGKVDRDRDYWQFYALLWNAYRRSTLLLCRRRGRLLGYARCDRHGDRLTVCELCARPSAPEVAEALLGLVQEQAGRAGVDLLSFALPPDHFVWPVLQQHAVALRPEPPGVARETFMVRPAAGHASPALLRLTWPLADKF